ncbi:acetolactate decarboxylase [Fischerella muscicola]|uniref:acetolactate decarboxylase n=1 Tax=Fischerella muscicola TaxID=92938 RepID=UPI002155EF96|nr:acetolactate decarboxylase [Fischerella muscicola]
MKFKPYLWLAVVCTTALGIVIPGRTQQSKPSNILFQISTINALIAGVYDGDTNFKELKAHGNFGLGLLIVHISICHWDILNFLLET